MSRYAAFLRGINVGGHRVKSAELRAIFEAMGLRDVDSFRASGNLVFAADDEPTRELTARIERGLALALGYDAATFLRSAGEVLAIAASEPFAAARLGASTGKLQVAMLSDRPTASVRKQVLALASHQDRLAFGERELYWLPSGGTMDSALDLKLIERLLGRLTLRTSNTIAQIAARHFA
jgi:uncharacterized protein (DUF1697 family)